MPIQDWERLQIELVWLRKRVNKADVLTNFKKVLSNLKKDLQNENLDANCEISADDFLTQLHTFIKPFYQNYAKPSRLFTH